MLTELPDGLRLYVQLLEKLASLLGDIVVNKIGHAELLHVLPLEASQMNSALYQGRERGGVAGRAGNQNSGVREQSTLQEVGCVAERRSAAHALVVAVQDEEYAVFHKVQGAPHLWDRVAQRSRSREQLSCQVVEHGATAEFA